MTVRIGRDGIPRPRKHQKAAAARDTGGSQLHVVFIDCLPAGKRR